MKPELKTKADILHYAILAKNDLARTVHKSTIPGNYITLNKRWLTDCLKDIEKGLGEGNQPSVEEILTSTRMDV